MFEIIEPAIWEAINRCASYRKGPSEPLPKEELIRCATYAALSRDCTVFVEPPFYAVGAPPEAEVGREEYDLWCAPAKPKWPGTWMEIKRGWSVTGYVNKPSEQRLGWERDLEKLGRAPEADRRAAACFLLVTVGDGVFGGALDAQMNALDTYLSDRGVRAQREDGPIRKFTWKRELGTWGLRVTTWAWKGAFADR